MTNPAESGSGFGFPFEEGQIEPDSGELLPGEVDSEKNPILQMLDSLMDDPKYSDGAMDVADLVHRLISEGKLPLEDPKYLEKFSRKEIELTPGVESVPPTVEQEKDPVYRHPDFDYDTRSGEITMRDGRFVELANKENEILKYLVDNPNVYVTSDEITEKIYGFADKGVKGATKVYISRINSKLDLRDEEGNHKVIKSRLKFGYMFVDESKKEPEPEAVVVEKVIQDPRVKEVVIYQHRLFKFNPEEGKLVTEKGEFDLTPKQAMVLQKIAESEGITAFRELGYLVAAGDSMILALNKKFRESTGEDVIERVRGRGYRIRS